MKCCATTLCPEHRNHTLAITLLMHSTSNTSCSMISCWLCDHWLVMYNRACNTTQPAYTLSAQPAWRMDCHIEVDGLPEFARAILQCWRQWQESVEEIKGARVALSFFSNITLRKAFNQWLVWAQQRQEYGTKLHLAVQVPPLCLCFDKQPLPLCHRQITSC